MSVFAVALAACGASPAAALNLVVNGGFEADPAPVGGYTVYAGGSSFTGWSVGGASLAVADSGVHEGVQYYPSNSERNFVEITGKSNTGSTNAITQTVATVAGQTYALSFFVGNAGPYGTYGSNLTLPSTIRVSIDGGALQSFTNADETPIVVNWRPFSLSFVAAGATTLTFQNGTANDGYAGLDDLSLEATGTVAEPASWALLIAGFGLTGAAQRRQRFAPA